MSSAWDGGTWSRIVPEGLWKIAEPLIPPSRVRPQGGGTQDIPDETWFAAIGAVVHLLATVIEKGRDLPSMTASWPTTPTVRCRPDGGAVGG